MSYQFRKAVTQYFHMAHQKRRQSLRNRSRWPLHTQLLLFLCASSRGRHHDK